MQRIGKGVAADEYRNAHDLGAEVMYELDGASEIRVQNVADALRALADGEKYKKFARTEMNARSSRAHSIFMLTLVQRHAGKIKRSTLHLCEHGINMNHATCTDRKFASAIVEVTIAMQ